MARSYYTYIATNKHNTVFYTGVTNDLERRMDEHIRKAIAGFTSKYNICKLVWYEEFWSPEEAIAAEKRIKGWKREKKLALIKETNPKFLDLLSGDPSQAQDDTAETVETVETARDPSRAQDDKEGKVT